MRDFPREAAARIYLARYWTEPGFSLVHLHHEALAVRLADFGVMAGPGTAAKQLQRCLNVLNRGGSDYQEVQVDGGIGPKTIAAIKAFLKLRGADGCRVLLGMVAAMQSVYLVELAERRPKDEAYQFGWQLNRAIGAVVV
jgi:lysozyme family protein